MHSRLKLPTQEKKIRDNWITAEQRGLCFHAIIY